MRLMHRISKWLHKYIGLILIIFLLWMSITGVLLNHPDLIANLSVPQVFTPNQYIVQNWNRSSLTHMVFSEKDSSQAAVCGKLGVFKTRDGGETFYPLNNGFPDAPYYRKTAHIFLWEGDSALLFAGTNNGLYFCNFNTEEWHPISLPVDKPNIKKIIQVDNKLMVFTDSQLFSSHFPTDKLDFTEEYIKREGEQNSEKASLIPLFFHLHSGEIWGLPGKLLYDAVGIILFFLSMSAFYSWYFPWKRKREKLIRNEYKSAGKMRLIFKWFLKYHLKLGIWSALILIIIGFTGFFMRPPFLVFLAGKSIPVDYYPGFYPNNPWYEKINNALFDEFSDEIIIDATDGFWAGPTNFKTDFQKKDLDLPVFVMGTTAFRTDSSGFLVGSFNGLFSRNRHSKDNFDVIQQQRVENISTFQPAEYMVTGYFETPNNEKYISAHEQGLMQLGSIKEAKRFKMPETIRANYRMPLWNWLFEIHNGRFFKDWIGSFYILIIPLGSALFLLISLSGIYDWLFLKMRKMKRVV